MTHLPIRAVVFDMGGTIEDVYYDDEIRLEATRGLREIMVRYGVDPGLPVVELYGVVRKGMRKYKDWREQSERELPPERVWAEFVFPSRVFPPGQLEEVAEKLALYYDTHFSIRTMRPEVPGTLNALRDAGLRLGIISNILSRGQVPANLAAYEIDRFFQVVVLSSCFGWRKPNPRIFHEAARLLRLRPAECAYVGDTVSRDVAGSQRAGYGLSIQVKSFLTTKSDKPTDTARPDAVVENLMEVVHLVAPA
ncbi:MAG: HAD family hydrolase [Rudaea sp.]